MAKIAFLNPKINYQPNMFVGKFLTPAYMQLFQRYPPLGLIKLAQTVLDNNHKILIIDAQAQRLSTKKLINKLKQFAPDFLCYSGNYYHANTDIITVNKIKSACNCKVILRGHFAKIYPELARQTSIIDYILSDDEHNEILKLISLKSSKHTGNNSIIKNKNNKSNEPLLKRHLLPINNYGSILAQKNPFTTMICSYGCPYKCTFCETRLTPYYTRQLNDIIKELEHCEKSLGIKEISFLDASFNISKKWVYEFCESILRKNIKLSWSIKARADLMDDNLLKTLSIAGCTRIGYGIESGCQKIADKMNRSMDLGKALNIINITKKYNIITMGYFMVGCPEETENDAYESIKYAIDADFDFIQVVKCLPLPKTEVHAKTIKTFNKDPWVERFYNRPVNDEIWMPADTNLTNNQVIKIMSKFYQNFYLRKKWLKKGLKNKIFYKVIRNLLTNML